MFLHKDIIKMLSHEVPQHTSYFRNALNGPTLFTIDIVRSRWQMARWKEPATGPHRGQHRDTLDAMFSARQHDPTMPCAAAPTLDACPVEKRARSHPRFPTSIVQWVMRA